MPEQPSAIVTSNPALYSGDRPNCSVRYGISCHRGRREGRQCHSPNEGQSAFRSRMTAKSIKKDRPRPGWRDGGGAFPADEGRDHGREIPDLSEDHDPIRQMVEGILAVTGDPPPVIASRVAVNDDAGHGARPMSLHGQGDIQDRIRGAGDMVSRRAGRRSAGHRCVNWRSGSGRRRNRAYLQIHRHTRR